VNLRERKKERTRDLLVREAIRLFAAQGFDRTSVEEIAAAADVSPRTFFRYFPTKADVVFADLPARFALLRTTVEGDRPVHAGVRSVLAGTLDALGRDAALFAARNRLVLEHPQLRMRLLEFFAAAEAVVADAYARQADLSPGSLGPRLAAAITVGAGRSAMLTWTSEGGDPQALLEHAFAATAPAVRRVLRAD
jgi:AcrR family transcriptional regulator